MVFKSFGAPRTDQSRQAENLALVELDADMVEPIAEEQSPSPPEPPDKEQFASRFEIK